MTDETLRADCARCAALCCVALAFDRGQHFAYDKAAGEVCRHLATDSRCSIHHRLETEGFGGCVRFDCHGAGQRVTQEVFGGRSWRDDPARLRPMMEAFGVMREIHDMLGLLQAARTLPLSEEQQVLLEDLTAVLVPEGGWSRETLASFNSKRHAKAVHSFLQGLRDVVSGPAADALPRPA